MPWFHTHAHSEFSALDGMPSVDNMVERVLKNKQPALALTDHGVMSGAFKLYRQCTKAGIMPFPGQEFYIVKDHADHKADRYHLGMLALTEKGYKGLVKLSTMAHQRDHYNRKPRVDYNDLVNWAAYFGNDVAVTSGCYFGLPIQSLVNIGEDACESALLMFDKWFPNFYVEVQHHNTDHGDGWNDTNVAEAMVHLAEKHGWPILVTQDSHYCDKNDKEVHDTMKELTMFGSDPGDVQFPGDSYHLATSGWVKRHYADEKFLQRAWNGGLESCDALLAAWRLDIPPLDSYSFHVPSSGHTAPQAALSAFCDEALADSGLSGDLQAVGVYEERLEAELAVIEKTGFADYFLLVHELVEWCWEQAIMVQARGSANGSLVCYLLGITQTDPVHWDLYFERFLTLDRSKPPDIDLDIDTDRREDVINWMGQRHVVAQIGTYNTLGLNDDGTGSVFRKFLQRKRQTAGDKFPQRYGWMKSVEDLERTDPESADLLHRLGDMRIRSSAGAHAAGFVISAPTLNWTQYVPTMLIPSSGHNVTQMVMEDVEDAGILKVDLLGQDSLRTIARTLEYLGHDATDPRVLETIPLDDADTFEMIRKSANVAVFQLEGWMSNKGAHEMRVKNVDDLVLVMALYRSAVLDTGMKDVFLNRKRRKDKAVYPNEVFKKWTSSTFGVTIFQEQVLMSLVDMGMSVEETNKLLKAVKASQTHQMEQARITFAAARAQFEGLCANYDMDQDAIDMAWASLEGFSKYGFNKAHATGYALRAYHMAYLKCHHTLEFMAAVLETFSGVPQKEEQYMREARRLGIKLLRADVNISGPLWTLDVKRGAVRKGLTAIKGIGINVAQEIADHAPFADMDDLVERTASRIVTGGIGYKKTGEIDKGMLLKLKEAGALASLGVQRG